MRILLIVFLGIFIHSSTFAESNSREEVWVNNKYELKVKLKFYKSKIKAKNLTRRGWQTFRRVEPGVYSNFRGEKLILEASDVIVFTSRRNRRNIVFRPPFQNINPRIDRRGSAIGGTWKVPSLGRIVYISNTHNGIEARIEGQAKWTRYRLKDGNFYVDDKGNSYTVKNNNELFWESRDGRTSFALVR